MKARILVIEDNAANMELMVYLLEAFGYVTLKASNGKEGVESALRERPDLVICDLQMPVMTGIEVAKQMKSNPDLRDIPLIAVTAFAMVGDRRSTLGMGFDGYLSKPISPETFVQEVRAFLPRQRTGVRTVLVSDDEPVNLELASSLLNGSGYSVLSAPTLVEALRLARQAVPDLILSDVCMADGNGFDFIRAVKADPLLRSIPFVFLTSTMTSEADRRKGLALGAVRYLFRPIDPRDLLREIESCFDGAGKG